MTSRFSFDVAATLERLRAGGADVRAGTSEAPAGISPPQKSQVSQVSQVVPVSADELATLSEEERDAYEERAAIREYDGAEKRKVAERMALAEVLAARR